MGWERRGNPDDWSDDDGFTLIDEDGEEIWIDEHKLDAQKELDAVDFADEDGWGKPE